MVHLLLSTPLVTNSFYADFNTSASSQCTRESVHHPSVGVTPRKLLFEGKILDPMMSSPQVLPFLLRYFGLSLLVSETLVFGLKLERDEYESTHCNSLTDPVRPRFKVIKVYHLIFFYFFSCPCSILTTLQDHSITLISHIVSRARCDFGCVCFFPRMTIESEEVQLET